MVMSRREAIGIGGMVNAGELFASLFAGDIGKCVGALGIVEGVVVLGMDISG